MRWDFVDGRHFISVRVLIMYGCNITQHKNVKLLRKIRIFAKIIHTQKAKVFPLCEIVNRRIFE